MISYAHSLANCEKESIRFQHFRITTAGVQFSGSPRAARLFDVNLSSRINRMYFSCIA